MKTFARAGQQALLEYTRASFFTACFVYLSFPLWTAIVAWRPIKDDALLFVLASVVVHESLYLGFFIISLVLESQQWLQEYKIPRRPSQV